jgi:ribosome recycling factor
MIDQFRQQLQKLLIEAKERLKHIRGHRLAASLVENIEINAYGQKLPLKSLGSITQLGPLKLRVELWDKNLIKEVELAIQQQNVSGRLYRDGQTLMIDLPPLTEETRLDLLKSLNQLEEEIKIKSRRLRDDGLRQLKIKKEQREIGEDLFFKSREQFDEEIKKFNQELDVLFDAKKKEII